MDPVKLEKGKLIAAFPGFVETWNWMVDCWKNLRGDNAAEVKWDGESNPVVNVELPDEDDDGGGGGEDDEQNEPSLADDLPELPPQDMSGVGKGGGTITLVDAAGNEYTANRKIILKSKEDSHVKFEMREIQVDANTTDVEIKVGVYYKGVASS